MLCPRSAIHDKADWEIQVSLQASHAPAAEACDAGMHFPSLEVSNPFPVCDFPPKLKFPGCLCQLNTQTAALRTAEVLPRPGLYKRETGTSQAPRSRLQVQGSQERSTAPAALRGSLGCREQRPTVLLPVHLVGQLRVLGLNMRAEYMTEWRPSQRGFSPHCSELLKWELGRGGRIVHLPAFSSGLYLFVTAANSLEVPVCWSALSCLQGTWGWQKSPG